MAFLPLYSLQLQYHYWLLYVVSLYVCTGSDPLNADCITYPSNIRTFQNPLTQHPRHHLRNINTWPIWKCRSSHRETDRPPYSTCFFIHYNDHLYRRLFCRWIHRIDWEASLSKESLQGQLTWFVHSTDANFNRLLNNRNIRFNRHQVLFPAHYLLDLSHYCGVAEGRS